VRAAILALGIILGLVSASLAMPVAPLRDLPRSVQVHGCHHYYALGNCARVGILGRQCLNYLGAASSPSF
jgi:hypothetical protein